MHKSIDNPIVKALTPGSHKSSTTHIQCNSA